MNKKSSILIRVLYFMFLRHVWIEMQEEHNHDSYDYEFQELSSSDLAYEYSIFKTNWNFDNFVNYNFEEFIDLPWKKE